jgi:glycosyltransferase involved in cell wall biosynthesis
VFVHGALDPWFKEQYPLKHLKKWLYWPWAEYRVLRDARGVLFTTEEEKLLAKSSFWLYKARELVSGYGIADPTQTASLVPAEMIDEAFPAIRGKRIILFLSRIHLKKGCDLLIKAFARTCKGDDSWQLMMAGPDVGGMTQGLAELAMKEGVADRIIWTGMLTGNLKLAALKRADVYVLPSHSENFGVSVAEALAFSLPVLISNKVNIWREVDAYGAGFVEDDTLEGTCKALGKWVGASQAKQDLIRPQARDCFLKCFDINENGRRLLKLLQSDIDADAHVSKLD